MALHKPVSLLTGLALIALSACSPQAQDDIAREAARRAVTPVVQDKFPGVPVEPAVNCVIDNANSTQIGALALDAVTGPTESTVEIVTQIISKPETVTCLATDGLAAILN